MAITGGDTLTTESQILTLVDFGDWILAEINNPWDSTSTLGRYALINWETETPVIPDGLTKIEVPIRKCAVFSSVHGGIIEQLGVDSTVCAVADAAYFLSPAIRKGINSAKIADLGPSTSPSVEKIIAANPDIILTSPMENDDDRLLDNTGIKTVKMADYMEQSPLGRAEWIKLLGILFGCRDEAETHFKSVSDNYNKLRRMAEKASEKPKVITENMYSGVWYMPGGASYKATMFRDAGADYPWSDDRSTGSLPLSLAQVLHKAYDADVWILTTYGYNLTHETLLQTEPRSRNIKAFSDGLWTADTEIIPLFDEFPFNPDRLLSDYIYIFHPSLRDSVGQPRYFKHVDR